MYRADWILFVEFISHRVAARKILDGVFIGFFVSKIIFRILADLRGVRDQALQFGCVARNSWSSPSSDCVLRKHGWKNVAAARIASTPKYL